MAINLDKYLVHTCDIVSYDTTPATPDPWNAVSHYGEAAVNSRCYVYFGENELIIESLVGIPRNVFTAPTKWQIILPPSLMNTIRNKDKVENILDADGNAIREEGYIKDMKLYRHHRNGPQFVLGVLGDGDE